MAAADVLQPGFLHSFASVAIGGAIIAAISAALGTALGTAAG